MRAIQKFLDVIAGFLLACGAGCILLMMLQVMAEVTLRTIFKDTIPGTEEIVSAYYMIGCAFFPLAWVQRMRGHVMIEIFTSWMPARVAAAVDGVVYIACAVVTSIFTSATWGKAVAMTEQEEILIGSIDVLVWPSRWIVPIGLLAMIAYMLLHAVADLVWAVRGGERLQGPAMHAH